MATNSKKFLIQQNNNIYSIKPEFYSDLGQVELNKKLFDKYGTNDVNDLVLERNNNNIIQENSTSLGTGKMLEIELNLNENIRNINSLKFE